MKKSSPTLVLIAGTLGVLCPALLAEVKVDAQVVAPADPSISYIVSERGGHVAAVVRKGSRWTVTVDGLAGPRVDEVLMPSGPAIDPRLLPFGPLGLAAGRHSTDQHTRGDFVTFSHDGGHFAYLARQSEEWVLMEDGREVLRLPRPGSSESADFRLQFSSADGKHLLFAHAAFLGSELWVDGRKWPGFYASTGAGVDTSDPLVSPDGEHIAYPAQMDRDHRGLVVDGKVAPYYAEKLTYTSDSKHLIGEAPGPKGTALVADGKPLFTAQQILTYAIAPATNRIAAVLLHRYPDGSQGQFALVDGKPVEDTLCRNGITSFMFSPDGRHYAAICSNAPNIFYVVADGKKGEEYDGVGSPGMPAAGMAYSPDSSRLVYLAHGGGKYFVVVNGEESDDAFDANVGFCFSPDGRHLAYSGLENGRPKSPVVIDNKAERFERMIDINQFDFSPDGSRHAYIAPGNYGGAMYVDGKPEPLAAMNFAFSPDGKHLAITGSRPTDNVHGLWVDGTMVYHGERIPDFIAFSADSQHVFWKVLEPDKDRPGYWNNVTYADGRAVARGDSNTVYGLVTVPVGHSQYTIHPGWQTAGDTGLICVEPEGDSVKRITITPTDTSVASLLAEAARPAPNHT